MFLVVNRVPGRRAVGTLFGGSEQQFGDVEKALLESDPGVPDVILKSPPIIETGGY